MMMEETAEEERMGTRHFARQRCEPGGLAVTGTWTDDTTALRTYRDGVGLCGSQPTIVIQLIEETDGVWRTRRTWAAQGRVCCGHRRTNSLSFTGGAARLDASLNIGWVDDRVWYESF
jgi:hypothetical protein